MSDTKNVQLGVCSVFLGGIDLGYTKGGVDVEVKTNTHPVTVDQFGESTINEYIMKREVTAKIPLAETTLENMVLIMPGATLVQTGGAKATGTILLGANPTNGQTVIINGITVTFKTATPSAAANEVLIGTAAADSATNLKNFLAASLNAAFNSAVYTVATATVTITARNKGTAMNAYTLAAGTATVTVSGATLTGGTAPTAQRVDVSNGVGTNLLNIAQELRLHPIDTPADDPKNDFVIPKAATAGALSFAYKFDQERIFNVEFSGYPDPVTQRLYYVGDQSATAA